MLNTEINAFLMRYGLRQNALYKVNLTILAFFPKKHEVPKLNKFAPPEF